MRKGTPQGIPYLVSLLVAAVGLNRPTDYETVALKNNPSFERSPSRSTIPMPKHSVLDAISRLWCEERGIGTAALKGHQSGRALPWLYARS